MEVNRERYPAAGGLIKTKRVVQRFKGPAKRSISSRCSRVPNVKTDRIRFEDFLGVLGAANRSRFDQTCVQEVLTIGASGTLQRLESGAR